MILIIFSKKICLKKLHKEFSTKGAEENSILDKILRVFKKTFLCQRLIHSTVMKNMQLNLKLESVKGRTLR